MFLHTISHGEKPAPLVAFCHGLFGQGKNWTTSARGLEQTDPPFRSLLIDMPNHGRSDWSSSVDLLDWADEVAKTLRLHLDTAEATHLVGHSLGGKIAMLIALRHPELVKSLVVVDMSPVNYELARHFRTYVKAMAAIDLDELSGRSEADANLQVAVPGEVIRSFLLQNLRRTGNGDRPWRWQMNLDLLDEQLERLGAWPGQKGCYEGPVLWVGGQDSDYITDAYRAPMEQLFPSTRSVTIKNAGHWVHSEQPEVFQAVLTRFLQEHR